MKKYLLYTILFTLTALSACKRGIIDPAPGDRPEEKVSATLTGYSNTLTGNTNGWKAFLFPEGGGVYLFSMKFTAANRVTMLSDINSTTSTTPFESSYRLRQQQAPSLLFDTYSYIHLLADPDPSVAGGTAGNGLYSDFEFYFDSTVGDTIKLIGNRLGSKLMLVKATSATDFNTFTTGTADVLSKLSQLRTYFKRATIGGVDCEVNVNASTKTMTFSYLSSGNLVSVSSIFYVDGSTSTISFLTPPVIGTATVSSIKAITFDITNHIFGGTINGAAFQLKEAIAPLKFNPTAAAKWYAQMPVNFNNCWVSDNAFHYGIDDFCGFRKIPGYTAFWFAGASVLGADGIITFTTGLFAPYVQSSTTINSGIARFTILANQGTFTAATPTAVSMTSARTLMYGGATAGSFQDWYLIPTSVDGLHYDMVRVSDAQVWISWRPR